MILHPTPWQNVYKLGNRNLLMPIVEVDLLSANTPISACDKPSTRAIRNLTSWEIQNELFFGNHLSPFIGYLWQPLLIFDYDGPSMLAHIQSSLTTFFHSLRPTSECARDMVDRDGMRYDDFSSAIRVWVDSTLGVGT